MQEFQVAMSGEMPDQCFGPQSAAETREGQG